MASLSHTLHTKAGLDAAFSSLGPSTRGFDHREEILSGLQTGDAANANVFALPEVDNVDAFERQVVEYVKPNHGTRRTSSPSFRSSNAQGRSLRTAFFAGSSLFAHPLSHSLSCSLMCCWYRNDNAGIHI